MASNWPELEITPIEIEHKPREAGSETTTDNRQVRFEVPQKPSPLLKPPKLKREEKRGPMIRNICSAVLIPPIASGRQHLGSICEAEPLTESMPSHAVRRLANQDLLKRAETADVNGLAIKHVHPYVDWKSDSPGSNLPDRDTQGPLVPQSLRFWARSEALAALGLTLVEICLGRTLESIALERDGSASSAKSKLELGTDLVINVYRVFPGLGQVIERCLRCPWECDVSDVVNNDDFQHFILKDIVKPLANDYDHFCGRGTRVS